MEGKRFNASQGRESAIIETNRGKSPQCKSMEVSTYNVSQSREVAIMEANRGKAYNGSQWRESA